MEGGGGGGGGGGCGCGGRRRKKDNIGFWLNVQEPICLRCVNIMPPIISSH
jgi:hypothetical protein